MLQKRWVLPPEQKELVDDLQSSIKVHPVFCALLINRGIDTYEKAKHFFRPSLDDLHDPFLMMDLPKAVNRLTEAIQQKQKILLYGDYDVDGTTSVAMMVLFLRQFDIDIDFYIPDRYKEGYGISKQGIEYAKFNNIDLMIAMDCGIRAIEMTQLANTFGIDLVICDHHTPGDTLPDAYAVLDPKRTDCAYPFKDLSGCGVAFKLAEGYCIQQGLDLDKYLYHLLDLLSISIACDIVPVMGENRTLSYYGMQMLNKSPRLGLERLIVKNDIPLPIRTTNIVFKIGPLINAAGRLADAKDAVKLLIAEVEEEATLLANQLLAQNKRRQSIDKQIAQEAIGYHEQHAGYEELPCVVEYSPKWHKGVIGIAASRVVEHFSKPAIVFTESNGKYVGSARSVKDYNIYNSIATCSHLLENFGGHKYAAGMTIAPDNFVAFKKLFTETVSSNICATQLVPEIEADALLHPDDIHNKFYNILKQMEPFGPKNRSPVFIARSVQFQQVKLLKGEHIKASYQNQHGNLDVIGFFMPEHFDAMFNGPIDICYTIDENEWRGNKRLQIRIKDIRTKT